MSLSSVALFAFALTGSAQATEPTASSEGRVPRAATDSDSPITDNVESPLQLRSDGVVVGLGMLLSAGGDFGFAAPQSDDNGFAFGDARLAFLGEFGSQWRFLFQGDLGRAPAVLDFRLTYQPREFFRAQFGLFKVPFSGEFLTSAADTDMSNRSQVAGALAPGRSVGLELGGRAGDGLFFYRAGIFNSNGGLATNDQHILAVVRAGTEIPVAGDKGSLVLAANAAQTQDTAANLSLFDAAFQGSRQLVGADARFTVGPIFVASEFILGQFTPDTGDAFSVYGYHVTGAVAPLDWLQFLARWDTLTRGDTESTTTLLIPSISVVVPAFPAVQAQADAEIPIDDASQTRVLFSTTVAF